MREVIPNKTICLEFKDSSIRPHESDDYVCITRFGDVVTYPYSKVYDAFDIQDYDTEEEANIFNQNDNIIMWAKLPESIKQYKRKEK